MEINDTKTLLEMMAAAEERLDAEKIKIETLKAKLLEVVGPRFEAALAAKGKTYGSVVLEIDGSPLAYEIRQTVTWDQDLLRGIWESLPNEIGDKLIELKFNVQEKMFAGCTDPTILDALTDARTTKLSAPTIKTIKTKIP
jgi:hypothetical protein